MTIATTKMAIHKSTLTKRVIDSELQVKPHEFFAEVETAFIGNAESYLNRIASTQANRSDENRAECIKEFLENCSKSWTTEYQARFN